MAGKNVQRRATSRKLRARDLYHSAPEQGPPQAGTPSPDQPGRAEASFWAAGFRAVLPGTGTPSPKQRGSRRPL